MSGRSLSIKTFAELAHYYLLSTCAHTRYISTTRPKAESWPGTLLRVCVVIVRLAGGLTGLGEHLYDTV